MWAWWLQGSGSSTEQPCLRNQLDAGRQRQRGADGQPTEGNTSTGTVAGLRDDSTVDNGGAGALKSPRARTRPPRDASPTDRNDAPFQLECAGNQGTAQSLRDPDVSVDGCTATDTCARDQPLSSRPAAVLSGLTLSWSQGDGKFPLQAPEQENLGEASAQPIDRVTTRGQARNGRAARPRAPPNAATVPEWPCELSLENIRQAQNDDPDISPIMAILNTGSTPADVKYHPSKEVQCYLRQLE
jgi:hypothetical protein